MFRKTAATYAAFWSNFRELRELSGGDGRLDVETPAADKLPLDSLLQKNRRRNSSMVITAGHLPHIVALIAGILILIMPRLLNYIVAIYLIFVGLVGMGLLRWLHL
jgi:hypothetical protein